MDDIWRQMRRATQCGDDAPLTAHRARALLSARSQLVGMTTRLSNHIRGVLKTFGMLPGATRGLPFDRRVESLIADRNDLALIIQPMLAAWRQLREQIAGFDKAVGTLVKSDPTCRHLMSVPGIGVLSVLAYVSMVEDPARLSTRDQSAPTLGLHRDNISPARSIVLAEYRSAATHWLER
jgi:transposase